ncbi:DegT/DnrJ/EryC1/StrS family aminotransferase [Shewanella baltica]|nr:DegT/DnrJ/EryC1/StrS family aminotransferase [Shewanella baltica]
MLRPCDFPNAERFYEEILTLPLYPTLDRSELQYIVATLFTCIS